MQIDPQEMNELMNLRDLQVELKHIFPSIGSLEWCLRQNRRAFIDGGALFELAGRLMAHPEKFKRVALGIGASKVAGAAAEVKAQQ